MTCRTQRGILAIGNVSGNPLGSPGRVVTVSAAAVPTAPTYARPDPGPEVGVAMLAADGVSLDVFLAERADPLVGGSNRRDLRMAMLAADRVRLHVLPCSTDTHASLLLVRA